MAPIEFYQTHLNRVSRSFAACIARLESPLRSWVSLTYLICRVLDTVEDALWPKVSMQLRSFDELGRILDQISSKNETAGFTLSLPLKAWLKMFPTGLPEGEQLLLSDTSTLLLDLKSAPDSIRGPIVELVRSMAAGMRHFSSLRLEKQGQLHLSGLKEVNQYCFFVAGLVGETLSKLLVATDPNVRLTRSLLVDSHHFGLFLQKVNLLKDQFVDEREGRFLVPSRRDLFLSLREHAEGAMRYIEVLPASRLDYRVFCAWSLFLGLKTLPVLAESNPAVVKIERSETEALFRKVEDFAGDTQRLRIEFENLVSAVPQSKSLPAEAMGSSLVPGWFSQSYFGSLSAPDLQTLGLI